MKKNPFPVAAALIFILFFCLFLTNCRKKQETEPQWTVEEVDGVRVVKNSAEPLHGEFDFDLEEDLSIGGDPEKDNYYFPRGVSRIRIDHQSNIYAVDSKNRRVQKYDRNGKYMATIGRQGQGPGEFGHPSEIFLDSHGKIWIFDFGARAFKVFTDDGVYDKNVVVMAMLQQAFILDNGYIIGWRDFLRAPEGPRTEVVKIDPDTAELKTIAAYVTKKKESRPYVAIHYYSHGLHLCRIDSATFCYGFDSEYKIHIADGTGKTIRIIEKFTEPIPISHAEKEKTAEEGVYRSTGIEMPDKVSDLDFPAHRPFFRRLIADEMGRIYVLKVPSILENDNINEFEIFGADGVFLYRLSLPFMPRLIASGFIYEIRRDEDTGEVTIVRHKIKNWDEIKTKT